MRTADVNIVDEPEKIHTTTRPQLSEPSTFPAGEQSDSHTLAPPENSLGYTRKGERTQCKFCKQKATAGFMWMEGRARILACDKHHAKARKIIEQDNHDAVHRIQKISEMAEDDPIAQAVGEASMCWDPIPTGVFDSDKASEIVVKLKDLISKESSESKPVDERDFHGLHLVIEWEKGSTREGTNREGKSWKREMHADYGYIDDTQARDGEGVDVYVGPDVESDKVYIVKQMKNGKHDEDKCMLGFSSADDAEGCYRRHYPNGGDDHFGSIQEISFDDFATSYLAKSMKHKDRYNKKAFGENLPALVNGVGAGPKPDDQRLSDAYHSQNTSEDPDLKTGSVEEPYSSGSGPQSIRENDDHKMKITPFATKKASRKVLGKGLDPYKIGRIYSYDQLIDQHQHEIDINWVNKKAKKPTGRHFLWLRTAMPVHDIIAESKVWYEKNISKKWARDDFDRVASLGEIINEGGVITPLLVSPPGEKNGGLWEGYHRLRAFDMLDYDSAPVLIKIDPNDPHWKDRIAQVTEDRHPWFCIDLDGTILQDDPNFSGKGRPPLGEPFDDVARALAQLKRLGRVSIWTARQYFEEGEEWKGEIAKHLKHHKIPFDDIYVGKKPPADVFVDDKAVEFDGNWQHAMPKIERILNRNKLKEQDNSKTVMQVSMDVVE